LARSQRRHGIASHAERAITDVVHG
jgi:hypothetical protein